MSKANLRPVDPVVEARLADIAGELAVAIGAARSVADTLQDIDEETVHNVSGFDLSSSLKLAVQRLQDVLDRLDTVHLCDPSRRLAVRTRLFEEIEVPEEKTAAA